MVIKEAARKIKTEAGKYVNRENAGKVYRGAKRAAGEAVDAGRRYGERVHRNTATSPLTRTVRTSTGNWTVDERQEHRQRPRNSPNRSQNSRSRPRGEYISYDNSRREHVSFAGDSRHREGISFAGNSRQGGYISFAGPSRSSQKSGGNRRRRRRR